MADQAGMRAINQAVAGLADHPEPPDAFVRGSYRRLRVGTYRVLYELEMAGGLNDRGEPEGRGRSSGCHHGF